MKQYYDLHNKNKYDTNVYTNGYKYGIIHYKILRTYIK